MRPKRCCWSSREDRRHIALFKRVNGRKSFRQVDDPPAGFLYVESKLLSISRIRWDCFRTISSFKKFLVFVGRILYVMTGNGSIRSRMYCSCPFAVSVAHAVRQGSLSVGRLRPRRLGRVIAQCSASGIQSPTFALFSPVSGISAIY